MEFMSAMSKSGCRNMSFDVASTSTSPVTLYLHAGWVQTSETHGAAGKLQYNGTELKWDTILSKWIINGKTFDGNGQCIEIPGASLEAIQANGIVKFGDGCIIRNCKIR